MVTGSLQASSLLFISRVISPSPVPAAIEAPSARWHPSPAVAFDARVLRRDTFASDVRLRLPGAVRGS